MANWYLDTGAGGDTSGDTMINAFQDFKVALEFTGYSPGDILWVRRRSIYCGDTQAQNILPSADGTLKEPIRVIGWPRFGDTGVGSFFQGNNVVTNVDDITPVFDHHAGRYIKNVTNDRNYLITAIATRIGYDGGDSRIFADGDMIKNGDSDAYAKIHYVDGDSSSGDLWVVMQTGAFADGDSIHYHGTGDSSIWLVNGTPGDSGFIIDRKYAGDSEVDGAFEILEDEDYTLGRTVYAGDSELGDSWNLDGDSLARMDFGDTDYFLDFQNSSHWRLFNLNINDGNNGQGTVRLNNPITFAMQGCILTKNNNGHILYVTSNSKVVIDRCIFKGSGSGTSQRGVSAYSRAETIIKNSSLYNFGDNAVFALYQIIPELLYMENVNLGVELPNNDSDVEGPFYGKNILFGGLNGDIKLTADYFNSASVENYNKIHGQHKTWYSVDNIVTKTTVLTGSGDPQKRAGGSDSLIALDWAAGDVNEIPASDDPLKGIKLFKHEFWASSQLSKSYRYYIQADACSSGGDSELYLEASYIDEYGDSTYYHTTIVTSDEIVTLRGDTTDWSQYLEVTGIQPAINSIVGIACYVSFHDPDGTLYIDPQPVIY